METRQTKHSNLAIASLVLGIISMVAIFLPPLSILLGILAIIFGSVAISSIRKKQAIAGLICGIAGILLSIAIVVAFFSAVPAMQRHQRDTARKLDAENASSEVLSYTATYRGELPTVGWLSDHNYSQIKEIVSPGVPSTDVAVYTIGRACDGATGSQSYMIEVKLEDGSIYCTGS